MRFCFVFALCMKGYRMWINNMKDYRHKKIYFSNNEEELQTLLPLSNYLLLNIITLREENLAVRI